MFGVFLAFYLAHDHFPGATPLQFAFVGGLSFSVGSYRTTLLLIDEKSTDLFTSFYRISIRHNPLQQSRPKSNRHYWRAVYIVRSPSLTTTLSEILTHKRLQWRLHRSIFRENYLGAYPQPRRVLRRWYGHLLYRNCRSGSQVVQETASSRKWHRNRRHRIWRPYILPSGKRHDSAHGNCLDIPDHGHYMFCRADNQCSFPQRSQPGHKSFRHRIRLDAFQAA